MGRRKTGRQWKVVPVRCLPILLDPDRQRPPIRVSGIAASQPRLLARTTARLVRLVHRLRPGTIAAAPSDAAFARGSRAAAGSVVLVGAGPGDPELLTLKACRALQEADVLVVDRLVDRRVVDLARRDARRIDVGKAPGKASVSQAEINAILIEEAAAGRLVVRLKGGDPFVFGRAVEEIEAVEAAGFRVEVIPGVTAALAAAATARLPITERGKRRALTMLTGMSKDGPAAYDWRSLARSGQTLAVYMGVKAGPGIAQNLLSAGLDPATPVSLVENASLDTEKVATGRLDQLSDLVTSAGIQGPAILFIGVAPMPAAFCEARADIATIPLERAA